MLYRIRILLALLAIVPAFASFGLYDVAPSTSITNKEYQDLVSPLVNAARYQFMSPPPSTKKVSPIGFEVGAGVLVSPLPESAKTVIKDDTKLPSSLDYIALPWYTAALNLPFGLSIGASYASVPQTNAHIAGLGAQLQIYNPSTMPISVAIRGGYTTIQNISFINARNTNAEAVVSFPLFIIEPYVGGGRNWAHTRGPNYTSDYTAADIASGYTTTLSAHWTDDYALAGVRLKILPFIGLNVEAQTSSIQTLYSVKLAFQF